MFWLKLGGYSNYHIRTLIALNCEYGKYYDCGVGKRRSGWELMAYNWVDVLKIRSMLEKHDWNSECLMEKGARSIVHHLINLF
jgi:hypothetical protein